MFFDEMVTDLREIQNWDSNCIIAVRTNESIVSKCYILFSQMNKTFSFFTIKSRF